MSYSPNQNLEAVSAAGAVGCTCDAATDSATCRTSAQNKDVALICKGGRWQVDPQGDCAVHECRITRRVALKSELTLNAAMHAARLGSGFAFSGFDQNASAWVAMATASWSGITAEQTFSAQTKLDASQQQANSVNLDLIVGAGVLSATPINPQLIVFDRGGPIGDPTLSRFRATAWQSGSR